MKETEDLEGMRKEVTSLKELICELLDRNREQFCNGYLEGYKEAEKDLAICNRIKKWFFNR